MEERDVRQWCMFMHLSQFAGYLIPLAGIVVPIVLWQLKKDESTDIDAHGRMIVNALITFFIYFLIAGLLCLVLIGFPIIFVLGLMAIAFPIIGAVKANEGVLWQYPLVFKFL